MIESCCEAKGKDIQNSGKASIGMVLRHGQQRKAKKGDEKGMR